MESIIDILHKGGYSCVMKNREEVRTFTQRGVADLYDLYQADSAFIIRKTKCFDFWERNVLFPKTKRSFFRTPTLPFSA